MGCIVWFFWSRETVELFYLLNEWIRYLIVMCLPDVYVLSSNLTFVSVHDLLFSGH